MDASNLLNTFGQGTPVMTVIAFICTIIAAVMGYVYVIRRHSLNSVPGSQDGVGGMDRTKEGDDTSGDKLDETESLEEHCPLDGGGDADQPAIDPLEFSQHIPGHIKRTEQAVAMKKIQQDMTDDQRNHEREVQRQQLEAIFKLMEDNQGEFGVRSINDVEQQMKLYM